MRIIKSSQEGFILLEAISRQDSRGFFSETYRRDQLEAAGIKADFVQDNCSRSREAGTLRGLHYQLEPAAQAKLVRVTAGAVFDVIVDIRQGSPAFGRWFGFILSAGNNRQLYVPRGFAHGFCTLAPDTEVHYKVDHYYSPPHDRGIAWDDPELGIHWPVTQPVLSEKDRKHPPLRLADNTFIWEDSKL